MTVVKVRRVGNSNVVSLSREFEASGYVPGASVLVEELEDGELRILPTDRVRERVRQVANRVVSEHPEAMEILANYNPDDGKPSALLVDQEPGDSVDVAVLEVDDALEIYAAIIAAAKSRLSASFEVGPRWKARWPDLGTTPSTRTLISRSKRGRRARDRRRIDIKARDSHLDIHVTGSGGTGRDRRS